jgi:hypothetical protein
MGRVFKRGPSTSGTSRDFVSYWPTARPIGKTEETSCLANHFRENLLSLRKLLVVVAVAVFVALYIGLDLGRYFSLDALKAQQVALDAYRQAHPWLTAGMYLRGRDRPVPARAR